MNHFFHCDHISILFFLLHDLVDMVTNIKEKMRKGDSYTTLHQGLMLCLYQFHLALLPLRIVKVDISSLPNPHPHQILIIITRPKALAPEPSHSGSPMERKKKGKEKESEDFEDEGRSGRRSSERISKSNVKR